VQGTVTGLKTGLSNGSTSTPAAVLTLAAIGATGLVDWPLLLGVGGAALVLHQLNQRNGESDTPRTAADTEPKTTATAPRARRRASTKPRPAKKTSSAAPRKAAARSRRGATAR